MTNNRELGTTNLIAQTPDTLEERQTIRLREIIWEERGTIRQLQMDLKFAQNNHSDCSILLAEVTAELDAARDLIRYLIALRNPNMEHSTIANHPAVTAVKEGK